MTYTITDPVELRAFIMSRYESDRDDLGHACMKAVVDVLDEHGVDEVDKVWCRGCDFKIPCPTVQAVVKACAVSFG